MKTSRRVLLCLLAALLLLTPALAAAPVDPDTPVTLTLHYQDGRTPLVGARFDLYRVADMAADGSLTVTADFRRFGNIDFSTLESSDWITLAATLESYVLRDGLEPVDSGVTDRDGQLTFPTGRRTLRPGLYLVLGQRHRQDGYVYEAAPFLVKLPMLDAEHDRWVWDLTAAPKHTATPEPDTPDTVTRRVLKVWAEGSDPAPITVQLLRDGQVYDTVALNARNNWRYEWTGLDAGYSWRVAEETPAGYTVTITREGVTFVVTNTPIPETPDEPTTPTKPSNPANPSNPSTPSNPSRPGQPTLPQTGLLWWPVPVLICAGLLLLLLGLLRRKGASHGA